MTVSVPVLLPSPDKTGNLFGGVEKLQLNQNDAGDPNAFGQLLDTVVSAAGKPLPTLLDGVSGTGQPAAPLQGLPQGGKVLPLLEEILESAVAAGTDPTQVMNELTARLESIRATTDLDPQQAVALALFQVIDAIPEFRITTQAGLSSLKEKLSMLLRQQGVLDGARTTDLVSHERLAQDPKLPVIDKIIGQMHAQPTNTGQTQADALEAMGMFKRLVSAAGPVAPETAAARTDGVSQLAAPPQLVSVAASNPGALPSVVLESPLGKGNWDQSLGERVQWLVSQGMQRAQIRLNPAHLGPMEIRIQVQNDQANVQFTATHAVVRDAVEAALPRLREMLGASGVELVNVDVSSEQSFSGDRRATQGELPGIWNGGGPPDPESGETILETPLVSLLGAGRLDLFA